MRGWSLQQKLLVVAGAFMALGFLVVVVVSSFQSTVAESTYKTVPYRGKTLHCVVVSASGSPSVACDFIRFYLEQVPKKP